MSDNPERAAVLAFINRARFIAECEYQAWSLNHEEGQVAIKVAIEFDNLYEAIARGEHVTGKDGG